MIRFLLPLIILTACQNSRAGDGAAFRDEIKINVVNVRGEDSVTFEEATKVIDWTYSLYQRSSQVKVTMSSYAEIPAESVTEVESWTDPSTAMQYKRFYVLQDLSFRMGCNKTGYKCVFLLPPLRTPEGIKLFGGVGNGFCSASGFAIAQAGRWSSHQPARDRLMASGGIVAHETMHTFGEGHRNVEDGYRINLMDHAAGRYFDSHRDSIEFIRESVNQMRRCTGSQRKLRRIKRRLKMCRRKGRSCQGIYRRYRKLSAARTSEVFPAFE